MQRDVHVPFMYADVGYGFVGVKDVVQVEQEMKSAAKVTPSWAHFRRGPLTGGRHTFPQLPETAHGHSDSDGACVPMQHLKVYMPSLYIRPVGC